MTQEDYQYWMEYVNQNYFPFPSILVRDMSNWRHRSMLARALVRANQYAPAIELFQSIIDITVNVEEEDCISLSEVEDRSGVCRNWRSSYGVQPGSVMKQHSIWKQQ